MGHILVYIVSFQGNDGTTGDKGDRVRFLCKSLSPLIQCQCLRNNYLVKDHLSQMFSVNLSTRCMCVLLPVCPPCGITTICRLLSWLSHRMHTSYRKFSTMGFVTVNSITAELYSLYFFVSRL